MSFKDLEGQLACWMERLQQYDFEIIYRKGVLHINADRLSRRPCENTKCQYCAKIEVKEALKTEDIAKIVLSEENLQTQKQLEDPGISIILQGKETGIRPLGKKLRPRKRPQKYIGPIELP